MVACFNDILVHPLQFHGGSRGRIVRTFSQAETYATCNKDDITHLLIRTFILGKGLKSFCQDNCM